MTSGGFHHVTNETLSATLSVVPKDNLSSMALVTVLKNLIPVLIFFTIIGSFLLSLVLIYIQTRRMSHCSRVNKIHRHATVTVVIVITVYIACNIPLLVLTGFAIQAKARIDSKLTEETNMLEYQRLVLSDVVLKYIPGCVAPYVPFIVRIASVSLNSAINPFVYFFRMSNYKRYVTEMTRRILHFVGFSGNNRPNNNNDDAFANNIDEVFANHNNDSSISNPNDNPLNNNLNDENVVIPMMEIVIVHHDHQLSIPHPESEHSSPRPQSPVRRRLPLYIYSTPPSRSPPLPLRLASSSRRTSM
jgi:hypothetical protein